MEIFHKPARERKRKPHHESVDGPKCRDRRGHRQKRITSTETLPTTKTSPDPEPGKGDVSRREYRRHN